MVSNEVAIVRMSVPEGEHVQLSKVWSSVVTYTVEWNTLIGKINKFVEYFNNM